MTGAQITVLFGDPDIRDGAWVVPKDLRDYHQWGPGPEIAQRLRDLADQFDPPRKEGDTDV